MMPGNIELLMGHNVGISQSYYKHPEAQLLDNYLLVVNDLTIEKSFRLKQQLLSYKKKEMKC
jgi:hypothetical protein